VTCKPQPTPQQQIQTALETLLQLSPADNARLKAIPVPITWKIGDLKGNTLAQTAIFHDRAEITFDWNEINLKREKLEPIIAHELDHAFDAYIVFGVDRFISIVDEEKDLPWKDRTLEKSALKQEAETRKFLLKTYPEKFKGMRPERPV
jgi:hypothetical protein